MRHVLFVISVCIALGFAPRAEAACAACSSGGSTGLVELSLLLPAGLTLASLTLDGFSGAALLHDRSPTQGRMVTGLVLAAVGVAVDVGLAWAYWPILHDAPGVTATLAASLALNAASIVFNSVLLARLPQHVTVVPLITGSSAGFALAVAWP